MLIAAARSKLHRSGRLVSILALPYSAAEQDINTDNYAHTEGYLHPSCGKCLIGPPSTVGIVAPAQRNGAPRVLHISQTSADSRTGCSANVLTLCRWFGSKTTPEGPRRMAVVAAPALALRQ
jgi:hypothetical protein